MQNKIFFTHAFFLLYGVATHAYAIDDISLPDRIRQEQRLKELNQQLEEQITQLAPKPVTTQLQDFKTIVVSEEPCVKVKNIDFDRKTLQDPEHYKFHFMLRAIWNHPQKIIGKCIGTQSLRNLVNFAQNELIKKGFITSQVTVDPQDIQQGSLRLGVQIGRLRKIIVEGEQLSLLESDKFLASDPQLQKIQGNLSIQTNNTLVLDPEKIKIQGDNNIELISKNGDLTLLGYGGVKVMVLRGILLLVVQEIFT